MVIKKGLPNPSKKSHITGSILVLCLTEFLIQFWTPEEQIVMKRDTGD